MLTDSIPNGLKRLLNCYLGRRDATDQKKRAVVASASRAPALVLTKPDADKWFNEMMSLPGHPSLPSGEPTPK